MIDLSITVEFDFHSDEYRNLLQASNATAFQHPDWLDPFYRILAPAHANKPHIVLGRDRASGMLQLVLPMIRAGSSVQYAFLGVTDYACPIVRPAIVTAASGLAERLRAVIDGRPLEIAPVRSEHVAVWRTILGFDPRPLPYMAHSMAISSARKDRALPLFSSRRRNDLARKAKRLGQLDLERVRGPAIADVFLEAQTWRKGRFENDPLQLDHGLEFYREVALQGDKSGLSRTFRLSHDGRNVAMLFGLVDGPCFRYLILACNYAEYSAFSPGLLIFQHVIEQWAQEAGNVFDFTIGDEPYKRQLGCTSTPMYAFAGS